MSLVVDASTIVAALIDSGPEGRWAESVIVAGPLAAPHLMPTEVANILRRAALSGDVSQELASIAHAELSALQVELVPYEAVAERAWELRHNLTIYDASYVALAELLDWPLATLDLRLASATGPTCTFVTP